MLSDESPRSNDKNFLMLFYGFMVWSGLCGRKLFVIEPITCGFFLVVRIHGEHGAVGRSASGFIVMIVPCHLLPKRWDPLPGKTV